MYSKVLVCLSLDHGFGKTALDVARKLLSEGGDIVAVHVMEPANETVSLFLPEDHAETVRTQAEEEMAKRIGGATDIKAVYLTDHSPGRAISRYALKVNADCIVVGSYRSETRDSFLGSTTSRIVRHAPCPVHVLR